MNSKEILPNKLNQNTSNINQISNSQCTHNTNPILLSNNISSSISHLTFTQKQIIECKIGSQIIVTQLEEKKYNSNVNPIKSLLKEENQLISDSNIFKKSFNKISSNPFLNKENSNNNQSIDHIDIKGDDIQKESENNLKKIKTQIIRNSINVFQEENKNLSSEINNGTIRIKVFKSHVKPKRIVPYEIIETEKNIFGQNTDLKIENKERALKKITDITGFDNRKDRYKLLVKKIARQLKRKTKPPTKGYFYVSIIRTDKYFNRVKKIARKMKNFVNPPTHGFFYAYIEKEKQYKLLIKRIAFLLKKRIKFPTCKIIKVYESYRLLIKRIADALKRSMKKEKRIIVVKNDNNYINDNINMEINNENNNNYMNIIINKNNEKEKNINIDMGKENTVNKEFNNNIQKCNNNINISDKYNNDEENKMDLVIDNNEVKTVIQENKDIYLDKDNININIEKNDKENEIVIKNDNKDITIENTDKDINMENNEKIFIKDTIPQIEFRSLTYEKKAENPFSTQKISNNLSNFTFSKMNIIKEEMQKSPEQRKSNIKNENFITLNNENNDRIDSTQIEQLELVQQNKKEPSKMKLNKNFLETDLSDKKCIDQNENLLENENNENKSIKINKNIICSPTFGENIKSEEKKIASEACKIIRESKTINSLPSISKKNKSIYLTIDIFKKEKCLEKEEIKIHNKTHTKNHINLNLDNFNNIYNKNIEQNKDENINLSDIEVSKSNFINNFKKFLEQEKIEIINNYPVSLNEKNEIIFQQSKFWYLIIAYLMHKNNNISLYGIIHLLEQYNIWTKDKNKEIYFSIKEKIKEYINKNYSKEEINQFLFMNKFRDINQIFEKFEINNDNIGNNHVKNLSIFKEVKIDNINIINDVKNMKCKCDLCTNDEACIQKVCDLNKNKMLVVNNSDIKLNALTPEQIHQNIIKKCNNNNILHYNEQLFYKGLSKKKQNNCFSKSKTIFEEKTNIEYNYLPPIKEKKHLELENNIEISIEDSIINNGTPNNNFENNDVIVNNMDNDILTNGNNIPENDVISNGNTVVNNINNVNSSNILDSKNIEELIENGGKTKNYKNISKFKTDDFEKEKQKSIESEKFSKSEKLEKTEKFEKSEKLAKSAKSENSEKSEKEESKEEKEEEESDNEENKNKKKEKKMKKTKSRKKNKKKKEFTKIKNGKESEDNENDDNGEEKKEEERSNKKRKKTGNGSGIKKHKSKFGEKKEDKKNELEQMLNEDEIEIKKEEENADNNSKRRKSKSKTPNKKKNKKH